MSAAELPQRLEAFAAVNAAVKAEAWFAMPADEAEAFWLDVIEKSQALLEALAGVVGEGDQEAHRQRLVVLVTDLKKRGEGIVAGLGQR